MTATGFAPGQTSTEDESKGKLQKTAGDAKGVLVEKGQQARATVSQKVGTQLSSQADSRSTQMAEQVTPIADALRKAGTHLDEQGNAKPASQAIFAVADQAEKVGSYLREGDADRFVADFERFGRSRPWVLAGAGLAVGFAISRFLKASSPDEFESRGQIERYSTGTTGMATTPRYGTPATGGTGYGLGQMPSTTPGTMGTETPGL